MCNASSIYYTPNRWIPSVNIGACTISLRTRGIPLLGMSLTHHAKTTTVCLYVKGMVYERLHHVAGKGSSPYIILYHKWLHRWFVYAQG